MPYHGISGGVTDNHASFDSSSDWSIYKATTVLSDSVSFYDDSELFATTDLELNSMYEMQPKIIKTEPMIELLPSDVQHYGEWRDKFIDNWSSHDCLYWLIHELQDLKLGQDLTKVKMERFSQINGVGLKVMSIEAFNEIFPDYGLELFNRLQRFKAPYMYSNSLYSYEQWSNTPLRSDEPFPRYSSPPQESHTLTDLDNETRPPPFSNTTPVLYCSPSAEADSGYKSDSSVETTEQPQPPEKRRPGRPRGTKRKKKPEKLGRLWEFIRDLLLNPMYNPSLICWENYEEGTFRFVHSDRVAKLWGSKKDNVDMNYEKLSRAMRYYYKSKVLQPVYGKRLVYKFGPTATGWRSERPIFRQG